MRRPVETCLLVLIFFAGASSYAQSKSGSGWIEDDSSGLHAEVDKNSGAVVLKLGVEHSKKLEPIPFKLQVGEVFDEGILRRRSKFNWYRIPEWLAGKWQRQQESIVSTYDYQTGRKSRMNKSITSQQIADYGVQKDRQGAIWSCDLSGKGSSNRGSFKSVALIRSHYPVRQTAQEIVFKEEFVVLNVMNETNAIMDSFIVESITRLKPVKRGLLETTMSAQVYLADGTPKVQQESRAYDRLIKPYTSVDTYKGIDVRQDFIKFLESSNLGSLVPE